MKPLFAAVQFLTVIPFPKNFVSGEKDLEKSVAFFPIVGLLIGLIIAAIDYVIAFILPPYPASAITVIALTGNIGRVAHGRPGGYGRADFSAPAPGQNSEIMKDSRTGVMGCHCRGLL